MKACYPLLFLVFIFSCTDSNQVIENREPVETSNRSSSDELSTMKTKLIQGYNEAVKVNGNSDCGPNKRGCLTWEHEFEYDENFRVDISECLDQIPYEDCKLLGSFWITLCERGPGQYEVIYEEGEVWGWEWATCTDLPELADFDCILSTATEEFVNVAMPLIIDLWGDNGDCNDIPGGADPDGGYETWISNYVRQLCVIPCTTWIPFPQVSLVNCGESSACCEQKTFWCRKDDGTFEQTIQYPVQTGECSEGSPSEKCSKWPGQTWNTCRPRSCRHAE